VLLSTLLQDILHPSHHLLNVLLQIANKLGLSKKKCATPPRRRYQVFRATPWQETYLAQTHFRKTETTRNRPKCIGYWEESQNSLQATNCSYINNTQTNLELRNTTVGYGFHFQHRNSRTIPNESLAHDSGRILVCAEYGYPKGSQITNISRRNPPLQLSIQCSPQRTSKCPNSKPHGATRQQAIAKTPAK
jgi:hypothetical protein